MPELKSSKDAAHWQDIVVDWNAYAYLNRDKETARQEDLKKEAERVNAGLPALEPRRKRGPAKATQAWSNKVEARERRDLRKEKKARKKAFLKTKAANTEKDKLEGDSQDDASDNAAEERAAKRVRRGKVGAEQFSFVF